MQLQTGQFSNEDIILLNLENAIKMVAIKSYAKMECTQKPYTPFVDILYIIDRLNLKKNFFAVESLKAHRSQKLHHAT